MCRKKYWLEGRTKIPVVCNSSLKYTTTYSCHTPTISRVICQRRDGVTLVYVRLGVFHPNLIPHSLVLLWVQPPNGSIEPATERHVDFHTSGLFLVQKTYRKFFNPEINLFIVIVRRRVPDQNNRSKRLEIVWCGWQARGSHTRG